MLSETPWRKQVNKLTSLPWPDFWEKLPRHQLRRQRMNQVEIAPGWVLCSYYINSVDWCVWIEEEKIK